MSRHDRFGFSFVSVQYNTTYAASMIGHNRYISGCTSLNWGAYQLFFLCIKVKMLYDRSLWDILLNHDTLRRPPISAIHVFIFSGPSNITT